MNELISRIQSAWNVFLAQFLPHLEFSHSRVDRNTFYVNELLNEVLNIIRKDTKADVSILFNELVLKNVDQKYIELAKKNIYERKPFNNQFTKYQKKTLKQHNLI